MANGNGQREKKKVANRLYVNEAGAVVENEEDARAVRFEYLDPQVTIVAKWADFNSAGQQLIGLFGLKTWIGNLFNQDLSEDDINDRLDSVKQGKWPERQGVGGPRYDADKLLAAICSVKNTTGDAAAEAATRTRIEEEKGYVSMAMRHPDVMRIYNESMAKDKVPDFSKL
jgi:hypothetical protein